MLLKYELTFQNNFNLFISELTRVQIVIVRCAFSKADRTWDFYLGQNCIYYSLLGCTNRAIH
jgi:hypothetical protein